GTGSSDLRRAAGAGRVRRHPDRVPRRTVLPEPGPQSRRLGDPRGARRRGPAVGLPAAGRRLGDGLALVAGGAPPKRRVGAGGPIDGSGGGRDRAGSQGAV
ncbi:MAG: hypothetical protein AVDCRST_MAG49-2939, partial [uncultured Thermomicrobiales bacterium]